MSQFFSGFWKKEFTFHVKWAAQKSILIHSCCIKNYTVDVEKYVHCVLQMLYIMLKYLQSWWMMCLCDQNLAFHSYTPCHHLEVARYISLMHKYMYAGIRHSFVFKLSTDVILHLCFIHIVPVSQRLFFQYMQLCLCIVLSFDAWHAYMTEK
jgi:hypothetical protein